ncbi:tetratricopeptide repeat protein [Carnobacterium pleistocenium]|uniref:tetratricopeptide repeat protein n=1 Tax=Carnobacterium pleistocenium TaxID=181073 RepID=UPI000555F7D6|nr:tetratricopeptide repeat protein [Carnobacterium pleistocenium]
MDRNHEAFQLWEKGKFNEAIQLLIQEIDDNPANSDCYYNLATMFILGKKYEDAKAVLETAIEKYPENPIFVYAFGNLYYEIEDYTTALTYFKQVSQFDETSLKKDAMVMIGQIYLALNQSKMALAYFLSAYEEDKLDKTLILLIGNTLMQLGTFEEAKKYFELSIEQSPQNDEAWFKRGVVGMALKEEVDSLKQYFDKAKELDPVKYEERTKQLQAIEVMMKNQKD